MSIKLLDRSWRLSKAKGGELLVLLAIADFANDDGVAYPSIATLATKARLEPRTTQRAIRRLIAMGELVVGEGRGPHRTHLYHVILAEGDQPEGCQNVRVTKRQNDIRDMERVTKQPPNPLKRTVIHTERREGDNLSPSFEVFWAAYPRKEGTGACRRWWETHKPDAALVDRMLVKIEEAKTTLKWKEQGGKFIPMPATWLNQERWEDDYALCRGQPHDVPRRPDRLPRAFKDRNYREGIHGGQDSSPVIDLGRVDRVDRVPGPQIHVSPHHEADRVRDGDSGQRLPTLRAKVHGDGTPA